MNLTWVYDDGTIDWNTLSHLYKIAPLGDKNAEELKTVFNNSRYKCFVYDNDKLVGVGRALADGVDCSYICDMAIHPEYQGEGIGREIVEKLVKFSKGHSKIILFTSMGKEGFYSKLGFAKMNTAMAIFEKQEWAIDIGLLKEVGDLS